MVQQTITACLKASYAWGLLLLLSGCSFGMFLPSSLEVELGEPTPLRAPASEIQRLAIALPSTVETLTGVTDSSRGKLDSIALEVAERLPRTGRISLVPMNEFHAALAKSRPQDFRAGSSMSEAQWKEYVLKAAASVKADGVILLHGNWDSPLNLGKMIVGRGEYKRQVGMSVVAAKTGETLWSQRATVNVEEGFTLPPEEQIRSPVVSRLVQNLLDTLH